MKKRYSNFFEKLICMGAVILAVIPLLFVAGKSVQVPEEYLILLFKRPLYLRMMWNSLIITIPVLIGQLLLAPLAAYGFWQCRWKYKEILFYLYMIVMLMPLQLTFSAKLFSGELAGHSKFVLGNYSSGNVSAIGGISDSSADTGFSAGNVRSSQTGRSQRIQNLSFHCKA